MTTFYLIRHGETEWNRSGRWQGHADVPLTIQGRVQADQVARRLRADGIELDRIYASDLSRAFETAQAIADMFDLPVYSLPELREINVGSWSGMTRAEIMAQYPGALSTVFHPPDGETREEFIQRAGSVLLGLAKQHPNERLAIVSHGGTIRGMIQHLYLLDGRTDAEVGYIGNTSITELHISESGWHLARINDIAHVDVAQAPDLLAPQNESAAV